MSQSKWNPDQYARFGKERQQPFRDLMTLIRPRKNLRIVDLGCGTGDLTALLHEQLGADHTVGIDSSETMLARSAERVGKGLEFRQGDLNTFEPLQQFDVIVSNAALQWVGDHPGLLRRLADGLPIGGQLAVQVPANFDHVSHRTAAEVAADQPYSSALGGSTRSLAVLSIEGYAEALHQLGFTEQHVRMQVYGHLLAGPEEVVEWTRGTLLVSYQERLPAELFQPFVEEYQRRLLQRLPAMRPYFYPFKRILFWAQRS